MDYTITTWVDDDGSGTVGTVGTAARMNNIESGVLDATEHHKIGLDSAKPVATAANKNWRYYATDTGVEYQSTGSAWTPLYSLNTSSLKSSGNISAGTISSSAPGGGGGSGVFLDAAGLVNVDRVALSGNVFSGGIQSDAQRRIAIDYTGKVTWGDGALTGDTNLYRGAADQLRTDDNFAVGLNLYIDQVGAGAKIYFGTLLDTNLYRVAADTLATDDNFALKGGGGFQVFANGTDANPKFQVQGGGQHDWGAGGAAALDVSIYRDSSGRFKQESTVASDTGAVIRNKSGTGFSGWQYNDWNDNALAFVGVANNATSSLQYFRFNPGTLPLRLMFNSVTRYENNATGMAWWGNTPIARPARPTTLTEVINLIANYGLSL